MMSERAKPCRRVLVGVVALSGVLAGCVNYVPYTGDDAAKVRFRVNGSGAASGVFTHLRTITDGHCSRPAFVANLYPAGYGPAPGSPDSGPGTAPPAPRYPRADMLDSPDTTQSHVAEVRRYLLKFTYQGFGRVCGTEPVLDLQARHQYTLDFGVDTAARKCWARGAELGQVNGKDQWRPIPLERIEAC